MDDDDNDDDDDDVEEGRERRRWWLWWRKGWTRHRLKSRGLPRRDERGKVEWTPCSSSRWWRPGRRGGRSSAGDSGRTALWPGRLVVERRWTRTQLTGAELLSCLKGRRRTDKMVFGTWLSKARGRAARERDSLDQSAPSVPGHANVRRDRV